MIDLKNNIAVITGAGSGIGAALASKLHQLNASVILIAKTEGNVKAVSDKLNSTGSEAKSLWFACDVSDEDRIKSVYKIIIQQFGRIDILTTCAAAPSHTKSFESISLEEWHSVLSVDLDGVFLCCKIFGGHMVKQKYGRIINLTSFHTVATYPKRSIYNAAKSGVEGLTRALAVEWGIHGITVNAIAPGPINTPRTAAYLEQDAFNKEGMIGRTPNARIGETEDVTSLIAFLASKFAGHINGQQIVVDGAWTKSAWWGDYGKI